MKNYMLPILLMASGLGFGSSNVLHAQQYRFKQVSNMVGMKTETTVYVKGMRKRTESGAMMGMPAPPITIEQCDSQRTIKLNDKRKRYFIEPFDKGSDVSMEDEEKPATKEKPMAAKTVKPLKETMPKATPKKGGIITMSYAIIDTGERKNMYGFVARHIWTVQKMNPSNDACTMKDSMLIKTDGWYIDLPKFNCPIRTKPDRRMLRQMQHRDETDKPDNMPECMDSFVNRRSGKGRLGFALTETRTMKMGGNTQMSEFTTGIETMDFSTAKLDSMLFEIPPGYTQVKDESELEEKMDMAAMMKEAFSKAKENVGEAMKTASTEKQAGGIRIGVYVPTGDEQLDAADLQTYLAQILTGGKIDAVPVASDEEAKSKKCDFTLTTGFTKLKSGSKLGGLLKAIKNADPNAASSYTIEAGLVLTKLADGSTAQDQKVDGKYEGKVNDAAKKALDDGSKKILKGLK